MELRIESAVDEQYTALISILAIAGEHMHRVLGLSHWYPFPTSDKMLPRFQGRDIQAVYADDYLVGTFSVGYLPEPYYLEDMSVYWQDTSAKAMYFSGFALLPSYQQQGIGTQCMEFAENLIRAQNIAYMRFDAVANHPKLFHFYSRLGFRQCGILPVGKQSVMCFEKALNNSHD